MRRIEKVRELAMRNANDLEKLEQLSRQCVMYAGGPSANKKMAHEVYLMIEGMVRKCQQATVQETTDMPSLPPSGSAREVQADSSSTSEAMAADGGESTTRMTQPSQPSSSLRPQGQPAPATTRRRRRSSHPSGKGPTVATATSTLPTTVSPSGRAQEVKAI
jgi:hypothetical protein